jgi:hypothetical protein
VAGFNSESVAGLRRNSQTRSRGGQAVASMRDNQDENAPPRGKIRAPGARGAES